MQFVVADLAEGLPLAEAGFDLVVCKFVLDCFAAPSSARLLPRIARAIQPSGTLLVGDFAGSVRGGWRWLAPPLLWLMHRFFRRFAGIEAERLVDPTPWLVAAGLRADGVREWLGGFLRATRWRGRGYS